MSFCQLMFSNLGMQSNKKILDLLLFENKFNEAMTDVFAPEIC